MGNVKSGLEGIVRKCVLPLSFMGLTALAACSYHAPSQDSAPQTPEAKVQTFTPTAFQPIPGYTSSPGPTYTYTPLPTPTYTPTIIPTLTPAPTETPVLTPTETCSGERKIVVDLSEQMIYAVLDYDCSGEREFVNASLVSTGVEDHPTPLGTFEIWIKLESTTMSGPGYYLENVPWTMYFTEEGHGIHGTYWHDNFGTPMSHGCVNLPNDMAEWFYNWADVGTKVIVQP